MKSAVRPLLASLALAATVPAFVPALVPFAEAQAPAPRPSAPPAPRIGEGDFLVRVRGIGFVTSNTSDAVPALRLGADRVTLSDKALPEVDLSWFPRAHLALSVSATYPQTHDAFVNGTKVGTVKQTPLSARLQYHVLPTSRVRPYLGAGVFVAPTSDAKLFANGVGRLTIDGAAVGPVGQAGLDVQVATGVFLNADVRYAMAQSTLKVGGQTFSKLDWNPLTFGGGIGFRF